MKIKIPLSQNLSKIIARKSDGKESSFEALEKLVWDIKSNILEKAGTGAKKDSLINQLQSKVANYDGLRQPAYRNALNNFIINHTQTICGVSISEDELEEAWETLLTNFSAESEG